MILRETIRKILLEDLQLQIQQIKDKYVGEGKPMTEEDFAKIQDVSSGKFYLLAWLAKRVGNKMIKPEDIYKYKEYFNIFEKNKSKFSHKDINLYKTSEDLQNFLDEVIQVREGDIVFDEIQGKDNYVSQKDIERLESTGGIKYLGMFQDEKAKKNLKYQVFQVFGVKKDTWKLYRDILGKCKGRDKGAKIEICTIGDYQYFKNYLTDPKGSSYFLLYNLDDNKSPYQLHFESGQFMDKNDSADIGFNQIKFFEFVGDKVPKYSMEREDFPGDFQIPVKGKGFMDNRGKKQGLWKQFRDGKLREIETFKNDEQFGPFVSYYSTGKIDRKGTVGKDSLVGEYEEYFDNGKIRKKGVFNDLSRRVGVWYDGYYDGTYTITDYSQTPPTLSGFTKENKLRYVSDSKERWNFVQPYGNIVLFYPSGNVYAMGRIGENFKKLGQWTFYNTNGTIKAEGKYIRGERTGNWTDVLVTKQGKKVILVTDFHDGFPAENIKIYDENGKYLRTVVPKYFYPTLYWHHEDFSLKSFR